MIRNVHERTLAATPEEVGALIDSLSSPGDRLWPSARWPAMRLDAPLARGARGGHGPIRYWVESYEPGARVVFRFEHASRLVGTHRFELEPASGRGTVLRHVAEGRPYGWMRLGWPLCFRWLHDAAVEDALDRAQAELAGRAWEPRPLGAWVMAVRWAAAKRRTRSASGTRRDGSQLAPLS
jgi:hypothetical protein